MAPPASQKEEELSGFIFMCSGVTKAECYLNRVFGLPVGRGEVVEKIKPGTKLFLFDFDAKLLYGVYEATFKGGMNLHPSAFAGRFPAQVQFKIYNDCLPLPISSFRTAIKDNYQGSKFTPELNAQQVRDLLFLFKPIVAPSTTSLNPAVAYAAPETQMLALAPNGAPWMQPQVDNGVPGPRMPPPASNGRLNPSLTRYSQNHYRSYQVGPLHNRSQQIAQPQFVLKNELNPHLHGPHPDTPDQAPPATVNPYQFAENQPPYLSNEPYSRYTTTPEVDPRDQTVGLDGGYSGPVLQPVHNDVDGYPQGHNSYTIPKPSYVSPQGPHLSTQPSYSDLVYMQLQYVLCISILQLIGVGNEEADFSVNTTPFTKMTSTKSKKKRKKKGRSTKSKTFGESSMKKRREKDKTGTYATQPMSFISGGKMEFEPEVMPIDESKPRHQTASSSSYGAFEMHTTGFGSRMMAKMGFVDGGGLGKDGRGIAEPIQAIERPKSLGLGAMAPETEPVDTTLPQRFNRSTG